MLPREERLCDGYGSVVSHERVQCHEMRKPYTHRTIRSIGVFLQMIGTVVLITILATALVYRNVRGVGYLNFVHHANEFVGSTRSSLLSRSYSSNFVHSKPATQTDDASKSDFSSVSIRFQDFMKFKSVSDFLETKGLGQGSPLEDLAKYVPMLIHVKYNRALMEGDIGTTAGDGYIGFAMQYKNTENDDFSSAYNIVLSSNGTLIAVSPMFHDYKHWNHFNAIKMHGDNMLLGAVNVNQSQVGPALLWNWKNSKKDTNDYTDSGENWIYSELVAEVDSHDIQWAYKSESIWSTSNDCGYTLYDISSGNKLNEATFPESLIKDPNHIQLIEEDTKMVISARVQNAIVYVNVPDASIEWIAGGDNGTFTIIGPDGSVLKPGSSYWSGQHNVEYFGNGEFMIFDDQSKVESSGDGQVELGNRSSRLLVVQIDSEQKIATVTWEYYTGYWTPIYGDNDQLPTRNLFSVDWPATVYDSNGATPGTFPKYDCRVFEITRNKDIAWQAAVTSIPGSKEKDVWSGWSIYSAERFYSFPLLYSATCTANENFLSIVFKTHSKYKEANAFPGNYTIARHDELVLATGAFNFRAHWLETRISETVYMMANEIVTCQGISVKVTDRFGASSQLELEARVV